MTIELANTSINRSSSFSLAEKRTLREAFDATAEEMVAADATLTTAVARLNALPHGSYYFSTPAATANAAATPIKAAGTTTAGTLQNFTHANNRLTLNAATPSVRVQVNANISFTRPVNATTIATFYIYKNGVVVPGSNTTRTVLSTTDAFNISLCTQVSLAATDYLELWCATVNGDDITVQTGNITVHTIATV